MTPSADLGFADALHLALSQDCEGFATFDKRLANRAREMGREACGLRSARVRSEGEGE